MDKKIILLILLVAVASSLGTVYAGISGTNVIFRTSDGITDHEVMRITSDQRVGINTTTPQSTLDVNGDIVSSGTITSPTITDLQTQINAIPSPVGGDCLHNVKPNGDLSNCYFRSADLSQSDLNNANLSNANLRFADLNGAFLVAANFTGANLDGANLSNAILNLANLNGANLDDANLNNANFQGASLLGITSVGCTGTPIGTPAQGTLPICLVCGDGLVAGTEACDDANTFNADGCSSTCQVESGFECSGTPSVCSLIP